MSILTYPLINLVLFFTHICNNQQLCTIFPYNADFIKL